MSDSDRSNLRLSSMSGGSPPEGLFVVRVVLIAAGFAVLASPTWLQLWLGGFDAFPLVSVVFTLVVAAIVAAWGRPLRSLGAAKLSVPSVVTAGAAIVLVAVAAHRLVDAVLSNPPDPAHGDMLTVIEQAGRRFLRGRDPYGTYLLPWQVSLPYGPPLWAPFMLPQVLRIDLRLLTAAGQLFVPVCCGALAVFEAARARLLSAAAWLVLVATIAFDPDLLRFVSVGHTPVYWPLLPLFAIFMVGERWTAAAAVLAALVAGRATMIAVVPVFLLTVWFRDRSKVVLSGFVLLAVVALILLPFFLWNPAAMWRGMITNYTQGIKQIVWRSTDGGAIRTIGLTGWLLSRGLEHFVELSQACSLAAVYLVTWWALRRGMSGLPFIGLALFAFSMTTVWPVYYVHFDVVLLLASAAMAEAAGVFSWRWTTTGWPAALVCAVGLVAIAVRIEASPAPAVVLDQAAGQALLRHGFSALEDDGARRYRWIESAYARLLLPRSWPSAADLVITGQPFVPVGTAPQVVTAVLNGSSLGSAQASGGWQTIRFHAPASTWRIGANDLELYFPAARSPRELGLSDDPRHLVMAVQRIDVQIR